MPAEKDREPGPVLYLLDASIYIFQAHFSPWTQILDRDGEEQSAFAGFARFLLRFLQGNRPRHMAVAFDESLFCGFRHTLYPDYKSNRVLPDKNLARQLEACAKLCRTLGVPGWGSRYYEADDIIGMLAYRARQQDPETGVCIISRDKDLAQLLRRPTDAIWDVQRNRRRDRDALERDFGIRPEQLPCYLGLMGDSVDCIPGVPGVGPRAAAALLQHFDSMDALYGNLDAVPGLGFRGAKRCRERLAEHREQAELSRELARIVEVPHQGQEAPFIDEWQATPTRRPADRDSFATLLKTQRVTQGETRRLMILLEGLT
jgi:5'-3' exonuclease